MLAIFRVALRIASFKRIVSWVTPNVPDTRGRQLASIRRVGWAIRAVSRRSPIEMVCFPQALAAYAMLKRRHVPATMYYGVAKAGEKFEAHTWIKAGDHFVVGGEGSERYSVVASFPADGSLANPLRWTR